MTKVDRSSDTVQVKFVYWIGCVCLLTFGSYQWVRTVRLLHRHWKKLHSITIATIPILFAHASTVLNFLPRDLANLSRGELDGDGWCFFSAFWTIASVFAIGGQNVLTAFATHRSLNNQKVTLKMSLIWAGCSWAVGLLFAMAYRFYTYMGKFNGIYCCLESPGESFIVTTFFVIEGAFMAGMSVFYYMGYRSALNVRLELERTLKSSGSGPNQGGRTAMKVEEIVSKQGKKMVLAFYCCWFPCSFLALLDGAGVNYPLFLDMFAAWLLKVQISVDCLTMQQALERLERVNAAKGSQVEMNSRAPGSVNGGTAQARRGSRMVSQTAPHAQGGSRVAVPVADEAPK